MNTNHNTTRQADIQQQALNNALKNESIANYQTIFEGFAAKGISMADVVPRENVFTFHAWKALGRSVKKGEHGVKIVTIIPCTKKDKETGEEVPVNKVKNTTVFHVSQTEEINHASTEKTNNINTVEIEPVITEAAPETIAIVVPQAVAVIEQIISVEAEAPRELNAYEARIEAKRERYEAMAHKAASSSNTVYKRAREMAAVIPFGQPIHIGHYSERSDRNYRKRINNTFGKAFALQDKAKHYAQKASMVGTGGISSDDPDALNKLNKELQRRELNQERMKAANKAIRSNKTPEKQVAALVALGFDEINAIQLLKKDFCGRIGFASYSLTNNNANISRIKVRIAELESHSKRADVEQAYEGFIYREDTTENRIMFFFDGKPEAAARDILKRQAFKWSPSRGAWVRQLNGNGLWAGKEVLERLRAKKIEDTTPVQTPAEKIEQLNLF